jgi:mono/diheme cytochrome c family protein
VRRFVPFALLAVLVAGCGSPSGKVTTPTPVTVIGKVPKPAPSLTGDPKAGKSVFVQNCGACHSLQAAGTTGKVGPDLDKLPELAKAANQGTLDEFIKTSIVDPGAYIAPGYQNAMPPNFGTSLTPQQLADLLAFIEQSI